MSNVDDWWGIVPNNGTIFLKLLGCYLIRYIPRTNNYCHILAFQFTKHTERMVYMCQMSENWSVLQKVKENK